MKLALTAFLDGFDDSPDGDPGRSAYLDTAGLLARDFRGEAEAIIERSREREVALQEQPLFGRRVEVGAAGQGGINGISWRNGTTLLPRSR